MMGQPEPCTKVLAIEDDEEADDDDYHDQDGPKAIQVQVLVMVTQVPGPGINPSPAAVMAWGGRKLQILLEWQNIKIYFIAETLPVSPRVLFS